MTRYHIHMIIKLIDIDGNGKEAWNYNINFRFDDTPNPMFEYLTNNIFATIEWVENNNVKAL